MIYPKSEIGYRLSLAMKRSGVKNTELSVLLDVSLQAITGWRKTGRIALEHLPGICDRCKCTIDWLLTGREPGTGDTAITQRGSVNVDGSLVISLPDDDMMMLNHIARNDGIETTLRARMLLTDAIRRIASEISNGQRMTEVLAAREAGQKNKRA